MSKKSLNLALQGGGAYGAFTWGVLDRLLEEDVEIEGITGASAGAINAAALASGLIQGGNPGGRDALEKFWQELASSSGSLNPYQIWSDAFGNQSLEWSPVLMWMDILSLIFSPYQLNPFNLNPLKEVIRKTVDLKSIRGTHKIKLYVSATNIETNKIKIFDNKDLCEEALLASAALPQFYQAVNWQGDYYWDGGYMGNPILEPLIYNCSARDIFIIQINPAIKKGYPFTSREIQERINEIVFNSSLMREIRGIVNAQNICQTHHLENPYADLRLHSLRREDYMAITGLGNKYNTSWNYLLHLKEIGRKAMQEWLDKNYTKLGKETSMDLSSWRVETPSTTCLQKLF